MGNVRVNFTNLQKVAACQRRVTIIAKYTTDDWVTSQETKAMIVKAQSHPTLSHFITKGKVEKLLEDTQSGFDPITFTFSANSNYWLEILLEVIRQNIAG